MLDFILDVCVEIADFLIDLWVVGKMFKEKKNGRVEMQEKEREVC